MKTRWFLHFKNVAVILIALFYILTACAPAARSDNRLNPQSAPAEKAVEGIAPPAAPREAESGAESTLDSSNQVQERLVIKNASLTIVVTDPTISMDHISRMAESMGGYVVTANMYKQAIGNGIEVPRVSITIRVPAEKLNEALDRIRSESDQEPQNESISSQDVTNEYVDLQSRLKNLEAAEKELARIMEDANKTEDVLSVYNQLVQIREQIEVIKGQIKYYEQSAALSSISTELIADKAVQPIEIGGWKPVGVAKDAVEALINAMQFLVSALIWIIIFLLPILLVLGLIFVLPPFLIFRAWRRRKAKRQAGQKSPDIET
jgi:hypothetical protein